MTEKVAALGPKRMSLIFVLALGSCSQPPPPQNYPLLVGASAPSAPPPPPINEPLTGFGDLSFGTLAYDAETQGYSLEVDDNGPYLVGNPTVDGIPFRERVNLSGTPAQVSSIALLSGDPGNDGVDCPNPQTLFNFLAAKYGPEKTTSMSSGLISAQGMNDENIYTWTFQGGRTIELMDFQGECPSVDYSEAAEPIKTPSF